MVSCHVAFLNIVHLYFVYQTLPIHTSFPNTHTPCFGDHPPGITFGVWSLFLSLFLHKATHFGICIGSSRGKKLSFNPLELHVANNKDEWLFLFMCSSFVHYLRKFNLHSIWCMHMLLSAACFSFMQYIVESARQRPAKRRISSGGRKSLYQKLYELYIEECEKEPELKVCVMQHDDTSLIMAG